MVIIKIDAAMGTETLTVEGDIESSTGRVTIGIVNSEDEDEFVSVDVSLEELKRALTFFEPKKEGSE